MAKGVMFSPAAAARIKASVRKTEGAVRTQAETQRGQILGGGSGFYLAKLTEDLAQGETATAEIWELDDDDGLYNTEVEITVKDVWMALDDDDIASGTLIGVSKIKSGKYIFTTVGCATS